MAALFSTAQRGEFIRIRTPFLYPDGGVIDIFAKENLRDLEKEWILTDLGETVGQLGFEANATPLETIKNICSSYGIEFENRQLIIRCNCYNISKCILNLCQAMMLVAACEEKLVVKKELDDLQIQYSQYYEVISSAIGDREVRQNGSAARLDSDAIIKLRNERDALRNQPSIETEALRLMISELNEALIQTKRELKALEWLVTEREGLWIKIRNGCIVTEENPDGRIEHPSYAIAAHYLSHSPYSGTYVKM